jgi:hypothetical protein
LHGGKRGGGDREETMRERYSEREARMIDENGGGG